MQTCTVRKTTYVSDDGKVRSYSKDSVAVYEHLQKCEKEVKSTLGNVIMNEVIGSENFPFKPGDIVAIVQNLLETNKYTGETKPYQRLWHIGVWTGDVSSSKEYDLTPYHNIDKYVRKTNSNVLLVHCANVLDMAVKINGEPIFYKEHYTHFFNIQVRHATEGEINIYKYHTMRRLCKNCVFAKTTEEGTIKCKNSDTPYFKKEFSTTAHACDFIQLPLDFKD